MFRRTSGQRRKESQSFTESETPAQGQLPARNFSSPTQVSLKNAKIEHKSDFLAS